MVAPPPVPPVVTGAPEPPDPVAALSAGTVACWYLDTARVAGSADAVAGWLADDDRQRADRFATAALRRQFIAQRVWLAAVLSRYANVPPGAVRIVRDDRGKPRLAGDAPVAFGLTHGGDHCIVAVRPNAPVGIDAEALAPVADGPALARRFFAPEEAAALARRPAAIRDRAFLSVWTRKEAVLKALGLGLGGALDGFAVTAWPDPPRLLGSRLPALDPAAWALFDAEPAAGCLACLATPVPVRAVRWRTLAGTGPVAAPALADGALPWTDLDPAPVRSAGGLGAGVL